MKNIPYATQWIDNKDVLAVGKTLLLECITQGPKTGEFEELIAGRCGARYAVAVNSGTAALHIACLAAGLKKGDEGITSPITFVASPNCMLYCSARPVFADIDEDTACVSNDSLEKLITPRTKVVIPVHFGGHSCDMDSLYKVAKREHLTVIEDACHAIGAEYKGTKVGSCAYSDMTVFSFHAIKQMTTGEGGMVLTNNPELYKKLKMLRTHGITRDPDMMSAAPGEWYYEMQLLGFNYRLTDFQCALGISQLMRLDDFIRVRKDIADRYDKAFADMECVKPLEQKRYAVSSRHLYVVRFDVSKLKTSRKSIFDAYRKKGIMVNVHYIPVYNQPYYRKLGYRTGICPKAEKYYEEAITLPLHPKMSGADVAKVIGVTKKIVGLR
ncbi:MAG: UDP-4-amino-4,6-dideoxy-N-acetyl-beta-L-altrosamine transaminase [Thermoanaerobaculaceae bacterium]|nr:UDP-4-amino-4,6-dideoxy-N-acetyl-beta-L-altrosamine transaminase [Thermoanaerobaculaceae bacterium]